ncbi:MAG: hypothetical protein WBB64_12210 [Anaerolineales bacterium]
MIKFHLNASSARWAFRIPMTNLSWSDGRIVQDLLTNQEFIISGTEFILNVEPWTGLWIS